jgi:polyvinyl alcohol dehydrogenase (cytochrome)
LISAKGQEPVSAAKIATLGMATGLLAIFSILPAIAQQASRPECEAGVTTPLNASGPSWNGWSPSANNARFQDAAAAGLSAETVKELKLKWAFNLGDLQVARAQPVIVDGRLFTTTQKGAVYALDAATGCLHWRFQANAGVRSGVAFGVSNGTPAVFFGDTMATTYALDANDGRLLWQSTLSEHPASVITAAPRFYEGVVYQPIASREELLAVRRDYQCCTFRGSVVALDSGDGKTIWRRFTIAQEPGPIGKNTMGVAQYGPSGAGVWSSPTIDEKVGALYVATGDNYSDPPTDTSDAILAMDLRTGKLLWSQQMTSGDAYNVSCSTPTQVNCPSTDRPDFDFGQPPILVDIDGGKRALVIAQKSGMAYAIDPDLQGKILWRTRVGEGGKTGGSQWGSATDGRNMYVANSDLKIRLASSSANALHGSQFVLDPLHGGGLVALDLMTGRAVWKASPPTSPVCSPTATDCSPAQSAAVTVIPGVVFSGSVDGHLRAYATESGQVLWDEDTAHNFDAVNGGTARGGSLDAAGPAVVGGMVFVNSGYGQWGGMPGNVLLAFSVNGQ